MRDLTKTYDRSGELAGAARCAACTLDVHAGEFVALTGPSGSGKSTFMHLLGCLDRPTSGDYLLNGQRRLGARQAGAGARPQHARSASCSRASTCCRARPRSRTSSCRCSTRGGVDAQGAARARAPRRCESVGLGERLDHHPNQLSGGQQQRVAIARALVNDPTLLLADEPTGNLDTRTSIEVMGIFQRLNDERGLTIVLVTHEPDIAEYGTRIVAFRDGRVRGDRPVATRRRADDELRSARGARPTTTP